MIEIVKTISLLSDMTDNVGFVWPAGAIVQDFLTHWRAIEPLNTI